MIGHYLETLTDEQLGRVLTTVKRPGSYDHMREPFLPGIDQGPCLVGAVHGGQPRDICEEFVPAPAFSALSGAEPLPQTSVPFTVRVKRLGNLRAWPPEGATALRVEERYDKLCLHFSRKAVRRDQGYLAGIRRVNDAINRRCESILARRALQRVGLEPPEGTQWTRDGWQWPVSEVARG